MAINDAELKASVSLDLSQAVSQAQNFARSFPTIKPKIDLSGLGQISRQASEFERSLTSATARVTAFGVAAGAVYAVSRAFDELVKSTIDVQKDLASLNVILNLSSNQLTKFSSDLFNVANQTAQSFKATAEVALQFSRQGLGVEEVLKRTSAALNLVRIGGADLDTSIKAITATLNTFNEAGLDANAILNRIATVDTKFAVSGNVIAEALTRVASTANEAGVSFNSLIGITTALQQITARGGSVIGNSLKSIFQRIQRPEVIEQLNQMGVATEDLNGQMLSADTILSNLAKRYNDLSTAQQQQVTQLAAGLFQANQFKAIINDLAKANGIAARATETASQATDQATRRQQELNKTLASQLQVSLNNLTQFGAKAGSLSIAPALENIFKGINGGLSNTSKAGETLGDGILKGLGNFLAGPGLALAGTLFVKFFAQFSSYALKSLSSIIEGNTIRYSQEQAIQNLLQRQPEILTQIVQLGGSEEAVQQVLLKLFTEQTSQLNQQAAVAKQILSLTSQFSAGSPLLTGGKPFSVHENAFGSELTKNPKFVPNFSQNSLADAINREQQSGINQRDIRIGTSNTLISPDNPMGLAVYNTKDEPFGLNQGIQRASKAGVDPKKAGVIPNFAGSSYYRNINSSINDPFNRPEGTVLLSPEQTAQLESQINDYKQQIRLGIIDQSNLNQKVQQLGLSTESSKKIFSDLSKSVAYFTDYFNKITKSSGGSYTQPDLISAPKLLGFPGFSRTDSLKNFIGPQLNVLSSSGQVFSDLPNQPLSNDQARAKLNSFNNGFGSVGNYLQGNQSFGPDLGVLSSASFYQKIKNQEIKSFQGDAANLGLGSYLTSFLPNSKFRQVQNQSEILNQQGTFQNTQKRLADQALIASFIAPIVAGSIQNLIPNTSTTSRGIGAGVGALGNIASYAAIGGAVFPGPAGVAGGAIFGGLAELPTVFRAFNDTLPDLEHNLDKLKESTTKINDAFAGFISTSNQLDNIRSGKEKASVGQFNQLSQTQKGFLSQLPQEAQTKIRNNPGDLYEIANSYNTIGQQNAAALQDIISLKKARPSDFPTVLPSNLDPINSNSLTLPPINSLKLGAPFVNAQSDFGNRFTDINPGLVPYANSILNFSNNNGTSVNSILNNLNPEQLKGLNSSNLPSLLSSKGFGLETVSNIQSIISTIGGFAGGKGYINQLLNPQSVKQRNSDAQTYDAEQDKQAKQIDHLNSQLANLTVTGTEAINNFEINVVGRLSKSLTQLKLQSISQETASKIGEINSGNNDYNRGYFQFVRANSGSKNQFNAESLRATSDFSNKVGSDFYNVIDNFTKGLQGTGKNKAADLSDLTENKRNELNSVLSGFFNINKDFSVKPLQANYSTGDVKTISGNIQNKINELENQQNSIGNSLIPTAGDFLKNTPGATSVLDAIVKNSKSPQGKDLISNINKLPGQYATQILSLTPDTIDDAQTSRQNIDKIIASYQSLLGKLTQDTADLNKALAEAKGNLDSNLQTSFKAFIDNFDVLGAQFKVGELNNIFSGNLTRNYGAQAFQLQRQAAISNPTQAIQLNSSAQLANQTSGILSTLNQSTQLGIANPNQIAGAITNQRNVLNNTSAESNPQLYAQTKGNIESLIKAQDDLTEARKKENDEVQKQIQSLTTFTDEQANYVRQQNINAAQQGKVTGSNYLNAFTSPLQYNNNTAQRDSLNDIQDFSQTLKEDLSDGLATATRGAKTMSKAFQDLAVSLGESLLKKGTDIGTNYLFSFASQGLSSLFGKKDGGYIPKFAKGGFVNMGSGTKDDVPAYLSGGEFVINKNAVNRIGKNNLDLLNNTPHFAVGGSVRQPNPYLKPNKYPNNFAGVKSDTVDITGNSANITLANAFLLNAHETGGKSDTSPLLSSIGQINSLNPQNKIRLGREKYAFGKENAYRSYQSQLSQYNVQSDIRFAQGLLGAAGTVGGAIYNGAFSGNGVSQQQADSALAEYEYGDSPNLSQSRGGYISKFSKGGYFGGDSSSDRFKAMVMGGEYVANASTVSKYGTSFFKSLNNVGSYADGGSVSSAYTGAGNNDGVSQIVNALSQIRDRLNTPNSNNQGNSNTVNSNGGNNQTNHVTINLAMNPTGNTSNESSQSSSTSSNQNGKNTQTQDKESLDKLSQNIKALVVNEITQSSRPGGLLYTNFQKKTQ